MASEEKDPNVIHSPLSREITQDGITVKVEIYGLDDREGWALELVDQEWNSTVWDETFATDQAAWDYIQAEIERIGLKRILETDEGETLH
jgi:hypothetical protein